MITPRKLISLVSTYFLKRVMSSMMTSSLPPTMRTSFASSDFATVIGSRYTETP